MTKNWNCTSIFIQNFFKLMKKKILLTPLQCIASDFFTRASKNFDTGADHFPVYASFTGYHADSFH